QAYLVDLNIDMWIDFMEPLFCYLDFGASNVGRSEKYLPVEVAGFHLVKIYNADCAHSGSREILQHGGAQPPGSNRQHTGGFQFFLALDSKFRNGKMPVVVAELFS